MNILFVFYMKISRKNCFMNDIQIFYISISMNSVFKCILIIFMPRNLSNKNYYE